MAASSALTRSARTSAAVADPILLSSIEKLLFAQAVHELGADAWPQVAKLLSNHPLISGRPKNYFTPQACSSLYNYLMSDAGLELPPEKGIPKAPIHLKLAQKYYVARYKELRELIVAEEAKFLTLVKEIDEIRSGKWDDRIRTGNKLASIAETVPKETDAHDLVKEVTPNSVKEDTTHTASPSIAQSSSVATTDVNVDDGDESAVEDQLLVPDDSMEVEQVDDTIIEEHDDIVPETPGEEADNPDLKHDNDDDHAEVEGQMDVEPKGMNEEEATAAEGETEDDDEDEEDDDIPLAAKTPQQQRENSKRKSTPPESSRSRKRARSGSDAPAEDSDAELPSRRRASIGSRTTPSQADLEKKRFQTVIHLLHQQISTHRSGAIFHAPIRAQDAPDYKDVILEPTDLKTIKGKVRDGTISNSKEYQREIYRMFANAMMYNPPHSEVYHLTEEMMLDCEKFFNDFRQTEDFHKRSKGV